MDCSPKKGHNRPMRNYDHTDRAVFAQHHDLFPSYPSRAMWHCPTEVGHVQTARGWGVARRGHGFLLQYVSGGAGWIKARERKFVARKGDLVFLDCRAHYEMGTDEREPWEFHWAIFESAIAHLWTEHLDCETKPVFHLGRPRHAEAAFRRLGSLARRKPPGCEAQLSALIYDLVANLYTEQARKKAGEPGDSEAKLGANPYSATPRPVSKVLDLIHQNYHGPLQFWRMVQHSGVSRSHLHALFQKHLGMSPMQYLCEFRIHHAKELLQHTNLLIKEVSLEVGIEDVHYFSRLFRQKTGDTPRRYRAKIHRRLRRHS